ncbi:uncharacterized protein DS421_15g505690 [Arachis hypogaea]|nr:uncharacterized protein DS421_15g505690 [Arachis hypogaea]
MRARGSRVRVIWSFSLSRVHVSHAYASVVFCSRHASASSTRTRHCHFALDTRLRCPRVCVAAFSSKLHFCAFLPFLYVFLYVL